MTKALSILFISVFISSHCWSQSAVKENKSDKTVIAKSQDVKNSNIKIPPGVNTNFGLQEGVNPATILLDVLFATNEDCDLYISEEFKGSVNKSKHKYIKLAPGGYVYKAKSKSTFDELAEPFVVKNGDTNEIFIDLLYVVDEKNLQRESIKNKKIIDSLALIALEKKRADSVALVSKKNKITPDKPEQNNIENKLPPVKPIEKKIETNNEAESFVVNTLLSNMISLNEGSFIMGNNKAPTADETEHAVSISPMLFSKYEVTQQQWETVMGYNPSNNKDCNTCPVENVSWNEVATFIKKINDVSDKKFRLPTEAEWEYVAKIGGKSEIDRLGGQDEYIKKTAWYYGNSNKKTHQVGQKQPNVSGVFDLFGNVSEWCADWYDADYYKKEESHKNPGGPKSGTEKTVRGGSYNDNSGDRFRPSLRNKLRPEGKSIDIGFRLVMDPN